MLLESNTVDWAGMSLSADNSELGPRTRSQILVENVGSLSMKGIFHSTKRSATTAIRSRSLRPVAWCSLGQRNHRLHET